MALDPASLQTKIDNLYTALSNDTLEVEDSDGNKIKYKSSTQILTAIKEFKKLKAESLSSTTYRGMALTLRGGKNL